VIAVLHGHRNPRVMAAVLRGRGESSRRGENRGYETPYSAYRASQVAISRFAGGPINYLILIGHIALLPRLFPAVRVPRAVQAELADDLARYLFGAGLRSRPGGSRS
jgi:hypothetical protein